MNLDLWLRICCLKDFLSRALEALITIYAILVKGIMGNIHVKLFEIVPVVQVTSFREKVYGRRTETITKAHFGSGELKRQKLLLQYRDRQSM